MILVIKDEEELFILSTLQDIMAKECYAGNLYITGGWTRAKLLKTYSYDFELLCEAADFEKLSQRLIERFSLRAFLNPFIKSRFVKHKPDMTKDAYFRPLLVLSLFNKPGRKYKLLLKMLAGDSIETDLRTRDFTINSIYCDVGSKELLDFCGGIDDFAAKRLRTIAPPASTFEDNVQLYFRMLEFSVKYSLKIDQRILSHLAKDIDPFYDIYHRHKIANFPNLFACVKKFFCKPYLGDMLLLAVQIKFIPFFRLRFEDGGLLESLYLRVGVQMKLLDEAFDSQMQQLKDIHKGKPPKDFFYKTRMLLVAFVFYEHDKEYALDFLNTFMFLGKSNIAKIYIKTIGSMYRHIYESKEANRSWEQASQAVLSHLEQVQFDQCQYGLLVITQLIFRQHRIEQKETELAARKENVAVNK